MTRLAPPTILSGNVLITGGAGTLGHAILRQATKERWPANFTIYSRSELSQARMKSKFPRARFVVGDVRDYERLQAAMVGHDTVIHAAAMKRIPECEQQPTECALTNIWGSANVLRAAQNANVRNCVGISTDKACAAITMYGASKRATEAMFLAAAASTHPMNVFLVRYGNVISSNGSVIPIWEQAAEKGQPLPVTHSDMTRFWMSPTQAVFLILKALGEGRSGTIMIPKMGSLPITTMAEYLFPGRDLTFVGLRSAEKIHEDLVHPNERAFETATHYVLDDVSHTASLGHEYTSKIAPTISPEAFELMLQDAQELERLVMS